MEDKERLEDEGAVEIFEEDSTITLFDEENNPIEFYEIASIEYNERFYELLQPVEKVEGIEEDEAVIFEYEVEEGTTEKIFKPLFDEELLNSVFNVYLRAVSDYSFDDCGCGCSDCGDCDCEHEHTHNHENCDKEHCDCKNKK